MSEPLLSVEDLRVGFVTEGGRVQAVDGVSFDLAAGEVLAIVGESGSGKSVTAQTIIGLTRSPNARIEGSVRLRGEELIDAGDAELRKVRGEQVGDGLPGPDDLLQPGLPGRRADRRGDPRPPPDVSKRGGARAARSSCSTRSASPTRPGGSTTTRTSSPAGCASGR